jgi:hypothetical protein
MTKSELKGLIKTILKEELLREAEEPAYEYSFFFAGARFEEDKFKQKLIVTLKALKSISTTAAIPEAVDVIVGGLKEGAKVKGVSIFELGDKTVIVKAKKSSGAPAAEETAEPAAEETTEETTDVE